jgi:hypothetical protein
MNLFKKTNATVSAGPETKPVLSDGSRTPQVEAHPVVAYPVACPCSTPAPIARKDTDLFAVLEGAKPVTATCEQSMADSYLKPRGASPAVTYHGGQVEVPTGPAIAHPDSNPLRSK